MKIDITPHLTFAHRHIGPDNQQIKDMLKTIGADSLEELFQQTIPSSIWSKKDLNLPIASTEQRFLKDFKKIVEQNQVFKSFIGLGYYNCYVPSVIQRNILENPGWYTAYTPYQSEIAQGRLEALINFQTMVMDLTAMELANASLLDEGTAAAEAMAMFWGLRAKSKKDASKFFVEASTFPQTIDVLRTRSQSRGIELMIEHHTKLNLDDPDLFGILLQYPNSDGEIIDYSDLIQQAREKELFVVVVADLLSLTLLKPPGEMGADAVVGTTQRFGVPLGFGGPHAGYFATKETYKRNLPGRIIGVSEDKNGHKAYRMALQTREQHIRRERATSNICTSQVLLAVMSGMYAIYHGPAELRKMAARIHLYTQLLDQGLQQLGFDQLNGIYFDTLKIRIESEKEIASLKKLALEQQMNFRYYGTQAIGISLDETTQLSDVQVILEIFAQVKGNQKGSINIQPVHLVDINWPEPLVRQSEYLTHPVFNRYHSEHAILRYFKELENKDLSLVHSMIPLGSCTMKLNATTEMIPLSWEGINGIHPFAPMDQAKGYQQIFENLKQWLCEITGFYDISFQPNSGAQGEYSGLMVIKAYHKDRGEGHRNVTLIPYSAHGTNPASAVMAGMKVVIVKCDEQGNIDLQDLKEKAKIHADNLAAFMVTYPSTHGVFEEDIQAICQIIHQNGGQVYMDGANLNAQMGVTNPNFIGADLCHLNLHKTFCIPHGGGGPGVGPIAVAEHLAPFLPGNPLMPTGGEKAITAISSAPWGSASILAITYAYISLMGAKGLKAATEMAILSANYIKERLKDHYKILYTGAKGRAAHELIIDFRMFRTAGVEVEDVAKRLMDYGFHAPTVSFPVPGTLMIEPTESEDKEELDRFCDALIEIREEISEIEQGIFPKDNNLLKNAPHPLVAIMADQWEFPYSRERAAFPLSYLKTNKFWPATARIDNAYGDRNLMCSCIPIEEYDSEEALPVS